ncbi:unnamed protein product [Citrullus colocynthis]|uniref:Ferulate 5-hydroxylase n=1 Tax=Citrullus colocynthis TaxID=252529 RepID=A0ABP0Y8N3_9ROSI
MKLPAWPRWIAHYRQHADDGPTPHRGLARLAAIYGGLFHLRLGVLHMVVVSTPDMAREFLQVQDAAFANRAANVAITYLTYDRADMAFANYGPFWRQMRKICVIKLFSRRRAESWASVRDEVDALVRMVSSKMGQPVNIGDLVFSLTRNITYKAAFGSRSHEGQDELVKILQEFSKLFGAFNIAHLLPWLGWIHARDFNERMAKARRDLAVFINTIIDEHLQKKRKKKGKDEDDEEEDSDMVDELMAFLADESSNNEFDDSQSILKLTTDNIKAIIMTLPE